MLTLVGILIQLIDQALCWFRLARVFGLVDSAVRVASAIHSANVDSSLQCWTSAHGARPGCSRSSARLSRLPTTPIAPSPRRVLHDPRQVDPWRSAPRVLPCARRSVTQYLRTTGLEHAGVATAAVSYFAVIEALPIKVLAAGSGCLLFSLMFRRSSFCESALRIASS